MVCSASPRSLNFFREAVCTRKAATIPLAPKFILLFAAFGVCLQAQRPAPKPTEHQIETKNEPLAAIMAAMLKRKRGSAQDVDALKRTKAKKDDVAEAATAAAIQSNEGWDAAFAPAKPNNELAVINGDDAGKDGAGSSDVEENAQVTKKGEASKKIRRRSKAKGSKSSRDSKNPAWKVSAPVGGRMIDVDPVFTEDEK